MIEALVAALSAGSLSAFFGGAGFRLIVGWLADVWKSGRDLKREIAMAETQDKIEANRHARQLELLAAHEESRQALATQELDQMRETLEGIAHAIAVQNAGRMTGVAWIDGWNGGIRPALATIALFVWIAKISSAGGVLDDWDKNLISAVLGLFVGERIDKHARQ